VVGKLQPYDFTPVVVGRPYAAFKKAEILLELYLSHFRQA